MSGWDDSTRTRPTRRGRVSCRSPGKDLNPALVIRRADLPMLVRHSRARRRMLQARGRRVDALRRVKSSPDPAGARAQLCDARAKKKADLEADLADCQKWFQTQFWRVCSSLRGNREVGRGALESMS